MVPSVFRSRIWARPDAAARRAGREGEVLTAQVRIGCAVFSGLVPLASLLAHPSDPEPWIGLSGAVLTLVLGIALLRFARRAEPPHGLGFFTCVLDVSIVSLASLALVASGHPLPIVNGRVFFLVYFLALALTCLRQDARMCVVAGLAAMAEYAALVGLAVWRSQATGVALASASFGVFRWDNQVARLLFLAIATAIHVAIVRQSHDLRRQRDLAEEASHAKSAFLANMSHEIRTPLNAALGMLSLLLDTPLSPKQREYVATARGSGTALLRILNDILDVSKIEAGRFEVEIAPFVLPDCLDEALALLSPKAESQGLTLRCEVADGVPEAIESDEDRLRQILVNLLDNAVKFSPRGEVRLTVERLPVPSALPVETGSAELRFAVHDTGIGIPADRMDRLFKPFSQADSSLSRLYGGTGLGLVISRRLVECLGGRIWVESEPGRGSTFYFTLPCRPAPVLPVRHPTAGDLSDPPLAERLPLRILLAEDNSVNQRVGLLMLERMGYDADVAGNGSEVLAALRRQPYDVILMDLQMPGMDGLEATRRLRAELPPERQPRIVAMTANVLREQREACLAAGMDDFVQKPVSLTDLKEALQRSADGSTRLSAALPAEDILTQPPPDSSLLDPLYLDGLRRLGGRTGRPLVREIVESYLTETPRRVGLLHEAVSRADAGALTFLAHSLKGSSAQLGAVRVAAVSARLEQKGRRSELAELPALLEELEREIARTLPLLEQAVVGAV